MKQERPFAARRRELGLPLPRAAARLRISPRYLRSLERGQVPLSLHLAQRMAAAYETSIDRLTRPTGQPEPAEQERPTSGGETGGGAALVCFFVCRALRAKNSRHTLKKAPCLTDT